MGARRKAARRWRSRVGTVGALAVVAWSAAAAAAQSTAGDDDHDAVVQVVVDLFNAMRARDEAGLRSVFVEGARLTGPETDDGGNVSVREVPIDRFIANVMAASPETVLDERIYDPEVRVDGDLATVWVAYDFYAGDRFSHCGYDAFQLARTAAGWKIFQIADTRRREGCPER